MAAHRAQQRELLEAWPALGDAFRAEGGAAIAIGLAKSGLMSQLTAAIQWAAEYSCACSSGLEFMPHTAILAACATPQGYSATTLLTFSTNLFHAAQQGDEEAAVAALTALQAPPPRLLQRPTSSAPAHALGSTSEESLLYALEGSGAHAARKLAMDFSKAVVPMLGNIASGVGQQQVITAILTAAAEGTTTTMYGPTTQTFGTITLPTAPGIPYAPVTQPSRATVTSTAFAALTRAGHGDAEAISALAPDVLDWFYTDPNNAAGSAAGVAVTARSLIAVLRKYSPSAANNSSLHPWHSHGFLSPPDLLPPTWSLPAALKACTTALNLAPVVAYAAAASLANTGCPTLMTGMPPPPISTAFIGALDSAMSLLQGTHEQQLHSAAFYLAYLVTLLHCRAHALIADLGAQGGGPTSKRMPPMADIAKALMPNPTTTSPQLHLPTSLVSHLINFARASSTPASVPAPLLATGQGGGAGGGALPTPPPPPSGTPQDTTPTPTKLPPAKNTLLGLTPDLDISTCLLPSTPPICLTCLFSSGSGKGGKGRCSTAALRRNHPSGNRHMGPLGLGTPPPPASTIFNQTTLKLARAHLASPVGLASAASMKGWLHMDFVAWMTGSG